MGIAKVNLRKSNNEVLQTRVEVAVHGNDSDSVSSGSSEFTGNIESELIVYGNQMFHVPYDLYDLSDLKDVLSLEAWNLFLTEDERFSLAAFLPDIDQQTFLVTMTELLKGENIFFGNPQDNFFESLKGGICSLKVSCFKEHLQTLERQKYYYSLHSYHDNMVHEFMDMKRRLDKRTVSSNPVYVVDLNTLPANEESYFAKKSDKDEDLKVKSSKRIKYCVDSKQVVQQLPHASLSCLNNIPKPRGVLKMKALKIKSTQCDEVQVSDELNSWGKQAAPKGILKVRKKAQSLRRSIGLEGMEVGYNGNESCSSIPMYCQNNKQTFSMVTKTESAGTSHDKHSDFLYGNFEPQMLEAGIDPPVENRKSVKIKLKILNR